MYPDTKMENQQKLMTKIHNWQYLKSKTEKSKNERSEFRQGDKIKDNGDGD